MQELIWFMLLLAPALSVSWENRRQLMASQTSTQNAAVFMHWMQLFKQKQEMLNDKTWDDNQIHHWHILFSMLLRKKILNMNLIRHADNEKLLVISSDFCDPS